MKTVSFLLLLCIPALAFSQVLSEDELQLMVKTAQDKSVNAHQSVIQRTNEDFAKSIWGKKIRFNDATIVRFFTHASGEKVSAGVDIQNSYPGNWAYSYDQKTAADLLIANGVRVTTSYNTLWIIARQDVLYAENTKEGKKTTLELYCPKQEFLEVLRTGQNQSIEFLITGYQGSIASTSKIYGVLTKVNTEKQVVTCSNGHKFDKSLGYKFCPTCGEPLK
jgi:hypothetical protein